MYTISERDAVNTAIWVRAQMLRTKRRSPTDHRAIRGLAWLSCIVSDSEQLLPVDAHERVVDGVLPFAISLYEGITDRRVTRYYPLELLCGRLYVNPERLKESYLVAKNMIDPKSLSVHFVDIPHSSA